ncbi:hypothetical protein [Bacillus sp. M6-12]|uniref:hypothetical protein n=1 Tax=Bacillus sp. M6-12 TaxID=2054166 RepID=UPI0015E1549D|nr:hypothetical protein [Bacillus sp. M6-12]
MQKMKCGLMTRSPYPVCQNYVEGNRKACEECLHNLYTDFGTKEKPKKDNFVEVTK